MNFFKICLGLFLFCWSNVEAITVYEDKESNTNLVLLGRVDVGVFNKYATSSQDEAQIVGDARVGISGSTNISTNIKGIAFAEWDISAETSQDHTFDARYAYVGFDFNQYGVLVFGQGDTASYQTVGYTDIFENFGSEANSYWTFGGRQEGEAMYVNAVGDYTFAMTFQSPVHNKFKYFNHDSLSDTNIDLRFGYALGFGYNWSKGIMKDFAISFSYDYYRFESHPLKRRNAFNAAISYGHLNDGLYLAGLYNKSKFKGESHHTTGWELVGSYTFENNFGFMLGWGYSGYEFDKTISSYLVTQLSYNFTDQFKVYTEEKFGLGKLDYPVENTEQHSKYSINLQYSF
ncbi:MAG: porin [Succinivibrionaceae bacterium]